MILDTRCRNGKRLPALVMMLVSVAPLRAQEPTPAPAPPTTQVLRPEPRPPGGAPGTVSVPARSRVSRPGLAQAGAPNDLRVISIGAGRAQVSTAGTAGRSVQAGDVIAGDVIREIGDGRIIMGRPEPGGGESTVVVSIDADGQTRIRVISLRLPAARRPAPPAAK